MNATIDWLSPMPCNVTESQDGDVDGGPDWLFAPALELSGILLYASPARYYDALSSRGITTRHATVFMMGFFLGGSLRVITPV